MICVVELYQTIQNEANEMKITEKNMQKLCEHELFSQMDPIRLQSIIETYGGGVATFAAGETVVSPESREHTVGIILSGKAIVVTPDKKKSTLLRYLGPKDLFGISNLFTENSFVSVIRTAAPSKIFYIPADAVRYLLETDKEFMYRYLKLLSGRICYLNNKIGYLTAGSAERRLAVYLMSLESNPVTLPLSISALSELLDIGRASLYRAFERLEADGYIKKDGRVFYLSNTEKMLATYQ